MKRLRVQKYATVFDYQDMSFENPSLQQAMLRYQDIISRQAAQENDSLGQTEIKNHYKSAVFLQVFFQNYLPHFYQNVVFTLPESMQPSLFEVLIASITIVRFPLTYPSVTQHYWKFCRHETLAVSYLPGLKTVQPCFQHSIFLPVGSSPLDKIENILDGRDENSMKPENVDDSHLNVFLLVQQGNSLPAKISFSGILDGELQKPQEFVFLKEFLQPDIKYALLPGFEHPEFSRAQIQDIWYAYSAHDSSLR